jgi:hypothetical protein
MNWLEMSESEILAIANPIMDNLMQASTGIVKGCLMPAHLHRSGSVRQSLGAGVGQASREETADDTVVSQRSR